MVSEPYALLDPIVIPVMNLSPAYLKALAIKLILLYPPK
jgi:hypothetical protein